MNLLYKVPVYPSRFSVYPKESGDLGIKRQGEKKGSDVEILLSPILDCYSINQLLKRNIEQPDICNPTEQRARFQIYTPLLNTYSLMAALASSVLDPGGTD